MQLAGQSARRITLEKDSFADALAEVSRSEAARSTAMVFVAMCAPRIRLPGYFMPGMKYPPNGPIRPDIIRPIGVNPVAKLFGQKNLDAAHLLLREICGLAPSDNKRAAPQPKASKGQSRASIRVANGDLHTEGISVAGGTGRSLPKSPKIRPIGELSDRLNAATRLL